MRLPRLAALLAGVALAALTAPAHAEEVVLAEAGRVAAVIHDGDKTLTLAGELLARDLKAVTGQTPTVSRRRSRPTSCASSAALSVVPFARRHRATAG